MICYFYRQPEHVRRDCPQRQGSQDFGTAQSQLAVEHESIQFIPPHPSTGQRNQFQFRGAIQAPSVAQVGQRSQRVGRGQVQDSQAETSSQAGQTICYLCRQPGHKRRDCPRRQRPHGGEAECEVPHPGAYPQVEPIVTPRVLRWFSSLTWISPCS